jgi:hypothetical protein
VLRDRSADVEEPQEAGRPDFEHRGDKITENCFEQTEAA